MPRSDHPSYNWPTQRHYLKAALKHLAAFTDNMQTFLELGDETDAEVLTLDFGTTSMVAEAEPLHTVMDVLLDDANEKTSMHNGANRELPSRDDFPKQRSVWTPEDDQLVKAGHKLGLDKHQLAAHLSRTHRAIEFRLYQLRKAGEL